MLRYVKVSMMDQQTAMCPICNGWGLEPIPLGSNSHVCSNCDGHSVQIKSNDIVMFWDMPGYIDYKGRDRARMAKIVLISSFVGLLLFSILIVVILGYQSIISL